MQGLPEGWTDAAYPIKNEGVTAHRHVSARVSQLIQGFCHLKGCSATACCSCLSKPGTILPWQCPGTCAAYYCCWSKCVAIRATWLFACSERVQTTNGGIYNDTEAQCGGPIIRSQLVNGSEAEAGKRVRFGLVGNAVSVPVASWIGKQLMEPYKCVAAF